MAMTASHNGDDNGDDTSDGDDTGGDTAPHPPERHLSAVATEADTVVGRAAVVAAHIHAATAELVELLGRIDSLGAWQGVGIRSIGHWATIELGIDAPTAAAMARAGRRLTTLPALGAAARAGEIGWPKLRLLDRVIEPATQDRWLTLARETSVGQLARIVAAYRRASDDDPDNPDNPDGEPPDQRARRRRGIWLLDQPDGLVRLTALLDPDDAAILRAALATHLEALWRQPTPTPTDPTDPVATTGTPDPAPTTEPPDPAGTPDPAPTTSTPDPTGTADPAPTTEPPDPAGTTDPAGTAATATADTAAKPGTADPAGTIAAEIPDPGGAHHAGDTRSPQTPGPHTSGDTTADGASTHEPGTTRPTPPSPATATEIDPHLNARDPIASRLADALISALRTALTGPDHPHLADDSTHVVLTVDLDYLTGHTNVGRSHYDHGPSISRHNARRATCDALIRPLLHHHDQPLDLGRATRTPNRALRRALHHRHHNTCAFPGCTHHHWLDAHHITHWADGGTTSLDNLILLCRHHHRLHHEGGYTITPPTTTTTHPTFHRPDGTPITPPTPPPPTNPPHHTHINRHTPRAHSGGAPHWSPQHAIDALRS